MNESSVWAVEWHDYDGGGVWAVFATKELADQHASDQGRDGCEVVEYVVHTVRPQRMSYWKFRRVVRADGAIEDDLAHFDGAFRLWDYQLSLDVVVGPKDWNRRGDVFAEVESLDPDRAKQLVIDALSGWVGEAGS